MSTSSSASSSSYGSNESPWQKRLQEACLLAHIRPPAFQIVSDRRGGRTAWSSQVTIEGQTLAARYWYDGKNLENAKEDAAELALNWLSRAA
ncbi:hypothetical protein J3F83DRAFT_712946 [Trichoderma novae-zelandiae]